MFAVITTLIRCDKRCSEFSYHFLARFEVRLLLKSHSGLCSCPFLWAGLCYVDTVHVRMCASQAYIVAYPNKDRIPSK
jgi:hypothetical protein